ncbi:MAG: CBS and ACT domain-containing protein [bacterium]|nr:CBS and ACT domain-containing protein [bacterium]
MYIGSIMRTDLITVSPKTSLVEAKELLDQNHINHLLVVKNEKLVGVVSDRDLKQNWASPATTLSAHELAYLLQKLTVGMIMVKTVVTATPDTTIERAAYIMQINDISSLPITVNGALVGIVTSTDVMGVLLDAIGMSDESSRLSVFIDDQVGRLAQVTAALSEMQINIQSFFCYPVPGYTGVVQVVMRVEKTNGERAKEALEDKGFKVMTKYHQDLAPFLPATAQP